MMEREYGIGKFSERGNGQFGFVGMSGWNIKN
jgi:hypothetical protein